MLKNIKKITLLLNLFQSREYVTQKQAEELCGIPKRSFYRYINMLSEIHIPIYNDRKIHGYRLSNKIKNRKIIFSSNEIILLILCLYQLISRTNKYYQNDIKQLISKILSIANFSAEEIINPLKPNIQKMYGIKDITEILNTLILTSSIHSEFKLKAVYKDSNISKEINIENPYIEFDRFWMLKDKNMNISIPIDVIQHLKLL